MRARTIILIVLGGLIVPQILTAARSELSFSQTNSTTPDATAGKRLFERHCALCHGIDGKGGRGPSLHRALLVHAPDDAALKSLIGDGIPPKMPGAWFLSDEDVANLAAYVRSLSKIPSDPLPGDPVRGEGVYAKSGCAGCHIIAGSGFGYGPELTNIGERRSPPYIQQAVVKPAASLPEDFLLVRAIAASGQTVEGVRVNEDTFSIQIKDAKGQFHSLRKQDLKELRKLRGESPMPSYDGILKSSELDDLVAYLASQRGKQ